MSAQRVLIQCWCPHCHYEYAVDLVLPVKEYERCPVCGHGATLDEFKK